MTPFADAHEQVFAFGVVAMARTCGPEGPSALGAQVPAGVWAHDHLSDRDGEAGRDELRDALVPRQRK